MSIHTTTTNGSGGPTTDVVPDAAGSQRAEFPQPSLGILHEHPTWFGPLFDELEARKLPFQALHAGDVHFSVQGESLPFSVLFNRMSPSAYLREGASGIFFTEQLLEELEARGTRVVNGLAAYRTETSKLRQIRILADLGLPHPSTLAAHSDNGIRNAAQELGFPLILKPNVGGSGAGVVRVDTEELLEEILSAGTLERGVDGTVLVQEFVPPRDQTIVRVEVVGGVFLYAIRIHLTGETFNLCPADVCQGVNGAELERSACPLDAPKTGLKVEGFEPSPEIIREVETLMARAGIEVGGVEYLIDDVSGERVYYDVNALSNFVADPVKVVGFDPVPVLGDYLEGVVAENGGSR